MARIRDEDVARVRDLSPIADVVGEHVQLRGAGGGRLKGLCPFHDEKTPSFNVRPEMGLYHCFGCGEGGDVIQFVREVETLTFVEAVEKLASRAGIELTYEQGGAAPGRQQGRRQRLVAAHEAAATFFAEQLRGTEARPARDFLRSRGFDSAAAEQFGVGYAPRGWDVMVKHLRGAGFRDEELVEGGLAYTGQRGPVDRFRGRLVWPIRDRAGSVVGFGARKLFDDDSGPKYLNTPETPLYKKSQVLYGLDKAKKAIADRLQVVVVEGYTDVMACHLAGVDTAVATCGTAFGAEHVQLLRPVMRDQDELRGEVVFTFDGDAAGQKAALRAFAEDQAFAAQTFVAVERSGLDPCDLRLQAGDAAVRDLVARRVPLFEFAVRSTLARHDLDTVEGREAALRAAVPVVARIKDRALRDPYAVRLAGWLGHPDEAEVVRRVREAAGEPVGPDGRRPPRRRPGPDLRDPDRAVEREVLKLALQAPVLVGPEYDALDPEVFTAAPYRAVDAALRAAGPLASEPGGAEWVSRVGEAVRGDGGGDADDVRRLLFELAVEQPLSDGEVDDRYARAHLRRLRELHVTRRIAERKSRLQRMNPVEEADAYHRLFAELVAAEQERRQLRDEADRDEAGRAQAGRRGA